MIPKIIHYCWFGRGEKSKLIKKCIKSWKKYCPDYEIIEWNEDNFDINLNSYIRKAYDNKKYAFVSDCARLYAMYTCGGIYMDTDVELIKNPDEFLHNSAFLGFEGDKFITTGIMACEKNYPIFKELLDSYKDEVFVNSDGSFNTTTNVERITRAFEEKGFVPNGKLQQVCGCTIYPKDYFCPLEDSTGVLTKTENTVAIHWFDKSWIDGKTRLRSRITRPFHRLFGEDCFERLKKEK